MARVVFFLVADDAFAMQKHVMKPFPGQALSVLERIHNYRLSRARRVVENAFGILTARFRVIRDPMLLDANKTKRVTLACCALHNFLIEKSPSYISSTLVDRYDSNGVLIPGEWRNGVVSEENDQTGPIDTPYISITAKKIREEYAQYFMSTGGELSWQYNSI